MLKAVLESIGVTSAQERTMHGLAWTSSSFRRQECVRACGPWVLISIHHLRMNEGSEKWFSLHPGPASGLCCCLICLLPSSCLLPLHTTVIPLCWGDTHFVLQSASSSPGNGARLVETNLHTQSPQQPFPACLLAKHEESHCWGVDRDTKSVSRGQSCAHLCRPMGSRGSGGCCGRERSGFTTCGWWGCEQGPSAPSRQLARSAVFAGSVKRTHFMRDIYHYPVLLKYSLCSRLELVRLLSSQVGGWWINLWVLQPRVNYRKSSPMRKDKWHLEINPLDSLFQ